VHGVECYVHQMAEGQDNDGDREASVAIQTCQHIVDDT